MSLEQLALTPADALERGHLGVALLCAIAAVNRRPRVDRVDEIDERIAELSGGKTVKEFLLECEAEAYSRGLSPPTPEQRDRIERQAAAYLLRTGDPDRIAFVKSWIERKKDVQSGRARDAAGTNRPADARGVGAFGRRSTSGVSMA